MPRIVQEFGDELIDVLRQGGVAVLRTDTLYGIVCLADSEQAVAHIYNLKHRADTKSPILLIADQSQLYDKPIDSIAETLSITWPGPYSIILPSERAPSWVTRHNDSVAYRVPALDNLRYLLKQTGPLIAPSANTEGNPPATTIEEAIDYFGDHVDIYVDGGEVTDTKPSSLLRFSGNHFERLR